MAPKSSSGARKDKAVLSEPKIEPKAKKFKLPKQFIVRPSTVGNYKSVLKVWVHQDVLLELDNINEGSLVYIYKEGELNGLVAVISPFKEGEADLNVIQMALPFRNLGAFLLGDRVVISKYNLTLEPASTLEVGTLQGTQLPAVALKGVEKIFEDIGIVYPGMILSDCNVKLDDSSDEKSPLNLIIISVNHSLESALNDLKLEDSEINHTQQLYSPAVIFKRGSTTVSFTSLSSVSRALYPLLPTQISYNSFGGLSEEVKLLKSTVNLPLHNSQLFTQFGINPPRGILLHGPPGTGKTMLLRAVANETAAHICTINGPSIVSKYLGETESAIRDIFLEARKYQPSIIFIDEIDSLAPNRNSDDSGEVESRVVATLLTLMDGMGDAGKLVVVAATNRPNSVDPLLRRPGRFDQEIEIGIPDLDARFSILKIQFEKMQRHTLDHDQIYQIASKTHGYVGADLIALCREAVMKTIQKNLDSLSQDLKVSLVEVESGLLDIRPSAMREIFLEMPKVYWSDIGGQDIVKRKLKEMVQLPLEAAETFKKLGIKLPRGLLLYGPPGCSKTLTAKALATESGLNFLAVKGPEIFNKYVGESEKSIREIFRKARAASPSIIFFDEIDAISQDRSDGDSSHTSNQVLTTLLNEIDGVEELNGVVVVAATNRPDSIDAALLRPGRLDRHIYVSPPDFSARFHILNKCCSKFNLNDVNLADYAELTEGCSGAEVSLLAQEAGLAAIMENKDANTVEKRHFEQALKSLSRGITQEMIDYYQDFADRTGLTIK